MKYICEVSYDTGKHEIIFVEAKNVMHLEYKMVEHLVKIYGSLDRVEGISYCPFKSTMFKEMYHFYGNALFSRSSCAKTHDNWLGKKDE